MGLEVLSLNLCVHYELFDCIFKPYIVSFVYINNLFTDHLSGDSIYLKLNDLFFCRKLRMLKLVSKLEGI